MNKHPTGTNAIHTQDSRDDRRGPMHVAAAVGLIGAVAASSCCIAPLALFGLGIGGAWIGNLTMLAPYQPLFLALTAICLTSGYWLVYRSRRRAAGNCESCARPVSGKLVMFSLVSATVLAAAAVAFDVLAPVFLKS